MCKDSAFTSHRYRDFNLVLAVTLPGMKHLAEVQVNLKCMLAAKREAHVYYEKVSAAAVWCVGAAAETALLQCSHRPLCPGPQPTARTV